MTSVRADEIYEQVVKPLPPIEQIRLVEKIAHHLAAQTAAGEPPQRYDWMSLRGIAPTLLDGEDAQAWVSRTRRESDEQREKRWRHGP